MKHFFLIFLLITAFSTSAKNNAAEKESKPVIVNKVSTIIENEVENKILFTVQIAALHNENETFENLEGVTIYIEDSFIKYRLGEFATYKEARAFRRSILSKYPDAFVQAIRDGLRVHIQDALSEVAI
ncbi:hypothetical protein SHK09_13395 [Polaribacter sp. PL03]|uniref:hypothetical protein n=1 Tax=Polaribacter sp. PL03 TaxID=3088353 RepID=UPI0029CC67F7|nr:hypothetical protein [Polaribacter sp. PL03]MDX6747791.1 hypothetical protein [Polaribacter sp. PL03]